MARWRREAEAVIADTLGTTAVAWVEVDDVASAPASSLPRVLSLVGHAAPAELRARVFAELARAVAPGCAVVVVDHNRPRRWWAAWYALLASPWVPGISPSARWRRVAQPTAREVQRAGLAVDRLRLVAGERVQIVIATRR